MGQRLRIRARVKKKRKNNAKGIKVRKSKR